MAVAAVLGGDGEGARFIDFMESDTELPDADLITSEQSQAIRAIVDDLPSHLREILLLSYFQQMSYTQIAESLEIPLGTVKSRLHAAVAAFGSLWDSIINNEEKE